MCIYGATHYPSAQYDTALFKSFNLNHHLKLLVSEVAFQDMLEKCNRVRESP